MSAARVVGLECLRCSPLFEGAAIFTSCPRCCETGVAAGLSVKLDLGALQGLTPAALPAASKEIRWR